MGMRDGTDTLDDPQIAVGVRPQHLIVTIFGRYGRARGGLLQIADLIQLMSALGVDAGAVRSSVSRLKQRGVLVSERTPDGAAYRLSGTLTEVFEAGDHRIFEAKRASIEDPWLLASFSVPERERPLRHQVRKLLHRLGFGQVSGGLWIATSLVVDEARMALRQAGLDGYVDLFLGARVSEEPAAASARRWWDLPSLEPLYESFLDAYEHAMDDGLDDHEAFAVYVAAVTQWRRLAYLEPGIPLELLPPNWVGAEAERLFAELHRVLSPPAERFVSGIVR